ncbi:iron(III) transport system permease protein [Mycobacterium sp. MAA66]|uniref:ABC transporter permease n=1 Tax=Mycobacterium sp. MAA66 TaxID=3156297 RepID=UPI003517E982
MSFAGHARAPMPVKGILTLAGIGVVVCVVAPLAVVIANAHAAGWPEVHDVLFRARSYGLLKNTIVLTALVGVGSAVVGTAAALCLERSGLPWARLWTTVLILPMAMPDFVVGFAWHSLWPTMDPLVAATVIMTMSSYPLVLLPVSAALRRADANLEDVARGLGLGPVAVFARVTFPAVRTAIAGGTLLAALAVISEYGAFEVVRFHTLTTEIFSEFSFDRQGAAALSIPLVLLGFVFIAADGALPRRRTGFAVAAGATRAGALPRQLAVVGFTAITVIGVMLPVGVLLYWIEQARRTTLPAVASLSEATETTFGYSAACGVVVLALATPLAYLAVRYPSRFTMALHNITFITRAVPGVIVAVSLVYLAINYFYPLYETGWMVIAAYAVQFFPLGLVCVHSTVASLPRQFGEVARSLGRGSLYVFTRVTLPLIGPGLLAGFCLVFVTAATELTTTLLLAPPGVKTLATQFWAFQSESSYSAAAPYALVIIAVSVVPGAMLGLWFDRRSQHATVAAEPAPALEAVS